MSKKTWASAYAVACLILWIGGTVVGFIAAWQADLGEMIAYLVGFALSLFLTPALHEWGHISFALGNQMRVVYTKFFCFRYVHTGEGKNFSLTSPFSADETQAVPKVGGNMRKRATGYTLGGLVFSGAFFLLIITGAVLCTALGGKPFALWGLLPYAGYSFLLNAVPLEYPLGKTDMLVYLGIKNAWNAERTMLSAMEIQGRLYAGETFTQIEKTYYFDLPQLPEDEPLYAVILDLRYRWYLEKGELGRAADCLERLAGAQEYLSEGEVEKLAGELVYIHALFAHLEEAEANAKLCADYLKSETVTAKRILAAWSKLNGDGEAVAILKAQGERLLKKELFKGVAKWEEILLSRIDENKTQEEREYTKE